MHAKRFAGGRCAIQYQAFISYSHAADRKLAPALQSALQRFGVSFFRRSDLTVYCDRTDLSVSPGLWTSIQSQLAGCSHLILLASPEAAQSPWVNREVATWVGQHQELKENLSIILTSGEILWDAVRGDFDWERSTALPHSLRGFFNEEPKYEDARELPNSAKLTLRNPLFEDTVASVAARLRGKTKRDLIGQELRQQRWQRRLFMALAGVFAILAVSLFYYSRLATREAEGRRLANEELTVKNAELDQTNKKLDTTNTTLTETNEKLRQSLAAEKEAREVAVQGQRTAEAEMMFNQQPSLLQESVLLAAASLGGEARLSAIAYQTLERGVNLLPEEVHQVVLDGTPQALSFGGGRLLAATQSTIDIWDAGSFRHLLSWKSPLRINDAQLSSDGKRVVLAGGGSVRVFEIAPEGGSLKEAGDYGVRPEQHVALSATGKLVASTTLGSAFRAFTVGLRQQLKEGSHGGILAVGFSPDESFLWSGGRTSIQLTPLASGQAGRAASCPLDNATHFAFSRNGGYAAAALQSGVVEVRRLTVNTAQPCGSSRAIPHQGRLTALAVFDDGRYVVTASHDGTARLWDLTLGRETGRATYSSSSVTHVVAGMGGSFWTAGLDRTVRLWAVQSRIEQIRHSSTPRTIAFSVDGRLVIGSEDGARHVWTASGSGFAETEEPKSASLGVFDDPLFLEQTATSPDGQVLSMLVSDGTAYLWTTQEADGVEFSIELTDVSALAASNGMLYYAVGNTDGRIDVHRTKENGKLYRSFELGSPVTALAFDPRSRMLAAATDDGALYTRSLENQGREQRRKVGAAPEYLVFTPDGSRIVTASGDVILVLDAASLTELQRYKNDAPTRAMAVSPAGRHIAVGGSTGVVRIWDLASRQQVGQITQAAAIRGLAFSPDGRRLAVASEDQITTVFFWEKQDLLSEACMRLGARYAGNPQYREVCPRSIADKTVP